MPYIFWLLPVEIHSGRKANIDFNKYDFTKEMRNLWILEVATDRPSVKIVILKTTDLT